MKKYSEVSHSISARLFAGSVEAHYGISTAIHKRAVLTETYLSILGLKGDECADIDHHGGLDRALHHYPAEHYQFWQGKYSSQDRDWTVSGMGENISTQGMLEEDVFIGDRYQFGDAVIEVSQPRSPCFKLNARWKISDFSLAMQDLGHCGWLYRVVQPGRIGFNADLTLIKRDPNALSIKEICEMFFGKPLHREGLQQLMEMETLSKSWRDKIAMRLKIHQVEDWSYRLLGQYEEDFRARYEN